MFFESSFNFWYFFVLSFLFFTGVGAWIQCWFLIKFFAIESKKRYYLIYLFISYASYLFGFFTTIKMDQSIDIILGIGILFIFTNKILKQNYRVSIICSALIITINTIIDSLFFPLPYFIFKIVSISEMNIIAIRNLLCLIVTFFVFCFLFFYQALQP